MIILKSKHTEYFRIREPGIQLQLLSGQLSILQRNFHGDDSRLGVVAAVCSAFTWLNIILSNT